MRSTRRIVSPTPVLLIMLLLIAACGGAAAPTTDTSESAPAAAASAAGEASVAASAAEESEAAAASGEASAAPASGAASAAAVSAAPLPVSNVACKLDPAPAQGTTIAYLGNKFPVVEYFANQLKSCEGDNLTVTLDWLPANERDQKANLVLSSGDTSYEILQATNRNIYEYAEKGWPCHSTT